MLASESVLSFGVALTWEHTCFYFRIVNTFSSKNNDFENLLLQILLSEHDSLKYKYNFVLSVKNLF